MTKLEFDNKISLGNIITVALSVLAIIGAYYDLISRDEQNTNRINATEAHLKEFVRKDVFEQTEKKLDRIELKLDRLIERDK